MPDNNKMKEFEINFAGKKLIIQTGKMCGLSNGSCLVKYGDTTVLVNATASKSPREGVDFLPLSVDFEERLYAVGKIPGSFLKREGRPTENAILVSRLIDRSIRPLFNKDMRNDIAVNVTVLSVDLDYPPEIAGIVGASIALSISDIPWNGPIAAVNVGLVDNKIVINPSEKEANRSDMRVTVSASSNKIVMIEANANQVSEATVMEGIKIAHQEIKKIVDFISDIKNQIGKNKFEIASIELDPEMFNIINDFAENDIKVALDNKDKCIREKNLDKISEIVHQNFDEQFTEKENMIDDCIYRNHPVSNPKELVEISTEVEAMLKNHNLAASVQHGCTKCNGCSLETIAADQ